MLDFCIALFFSKYWHLTKTRYKIAINGQEAVDLFAKEHFDLIFMDCMMPIMDGYTATKKIRQIERESSGLPHSTSVGSINTSNSTNGGSRIVGINNSTGISNNMNSSSGSSNSNGKSTDSLRYIRHVPIVALTAETDRHRVLQAGFDDYICKPIKRREVMLDMIKKHLRLM